MAGSLGSLVVDLVPEIEPWLLGGTGQKTAGLVAQAIEAVTGTDDVDAAQAVLAQDSIAVSRLRAQLTVIAELQQAEADHAAELRRAADLAMIQATMADHVAKSHMNSVWTTMETFVTSWVNSRSNQQIEIVAETVNDNMETDIRKFLQDFDKYLAIVNQRLDRVLEAHG